MLSLNNIFDLLNYLKVPIRTPSLLKHTMEMSQAKRGTSVGLKPPGQAVYTN